MSQAARSITLAPQPQAPPLSEAEALAKQARLLERLAGLGSAVVAYSGGVDSAYLLWAAQTALGSQTLAVIGRSDTYARSELAGALAEAGRIGAAVRVVSTAELEDPRFRDNPPDRCYHCKSELFTKLSALALVEGFTTVLDGTNADDRADYRPGRKAGEERGVLSPLAEAGLTKAEIRFLSRRAGLTVWDKPAMPCLSSRFPYGAKITSEKLHQVEEAEAWLRGRGYRECRVRHHGDVARIEVAAADLERLVAEPDRGLATAALRALGFAYVTVDLTGFRSGSLNEVLPKEST
ncbi:MAG TPA: ATP-dependent sacrificial sulfur transferase LarE [Candidatus Eisenbacteria bacterium]|nr:ATP-dependent sacrificial sulfur transferase LarE [Candidatus Eisenbacteria bacterium]